MDKTLRELPLVASAAAKPDASALLAFLAADERGGESSPASLDKTAATVAVDDVTNVNDTVAAPGTSRATAGHLQRLLRALPARTLVRAHAELFTVALTNTVADAIALFCERRITTALVYASRGRALCFLELATLLDYALRLKRTYVERTFLATMLASATVADVFDAAGERVEVPTLLPAASATAWDVFEQLGGAESRPLHRVLLVDERGELLHLVSQSDCVRWVHLHAQHDAELAATLRSLSMHTFGALVMKPVNSLLETSRVRDALFRLAVHHGGALPIVTRGGRLVAHMSMSDGLHLFNSRAPAFEENVVEYLRTYSPASLTPKRVDMESSLSVALDALVGGVHHLWAVCAHTGACVGCLSHTDLVRILVQL